MDLNFLLQQHQLSLMFAERSLTRRERRVHHQFAREYADQIRITRHELGTRGSLPGSVT